MTQKTFINSSNAATIGMLYTYWHEISKDGITHPTIDEQKEIEELVSLLPSNLVLTQISMQEISTGDFVYTYTFQGSGTPNFPSKALAEAQVKLANFFQVVNDLTDNAGHYYTTYIKNTNLIIGTFTIG